MRLEHQPLPPPSPRWIAAPAEADGRLQFRGQIPVALAWPADTVQAVAADRPGGQKIASHLRVLRRPVVEAAA